MNTSNLSNSQITAWMSFRRMHHHLTERLNREITARTGLSEADFDILTALTETTDDTVRALALRCGLGWEKSRLSHQLKRMEARGLLVREECVEDNRGAVIRVTDAGRKAVTEGRVLYDRALQQCLIDVLTPEQLEALGSIAETVLSKLEKSHRP